MFLEKALRDEAGPSHASPLALLDNVVWRSRKMVIPLSGWSQGISNGSKWVPTGLKFLAPRLGSQSSKSASCMDVGV